MTEQKAHAISTMQSHDRLPGDMEARVLVGQAARCDVGQAARCDGGLGKRITHAGLAA